MPGPGPSSLERLGGNAEGGALCRIVDKHFVPVVVEAHHHDLVPIPSFLPGDDLGPTPPEEVPELQEVALIDDGVEPALAREGAEALAGNVLQVWLPQLCRDLLMRHRVAPVGKNHGEGGRPTGIFLLGDEGHAKIQDREKRNQSQHGVGIIKAHASRRRP